MMGRSHLVISTGVTLSVLGMAQQAITLPVIGVALVSALLPDIDEPNSLLVSRMIPKSLLKVIQFALLALAAYIFFYGKNLAPWNTAIAALVGIVSFLPSRTMRNIVMVLIGLGLIAYGHILTPWNFIIGSLLIVCALVPHRGITHTLYGVVGWSLLLFAATH